MGAMATQQEEMRADDAKRKSVRALEWTNFFLADVQAGLGPFVAAYLASLGWQAGAVGRALTFGGIISVILQCAGRGGLRCNAAPAHRRSRNPE